MSSFGPPSSPVGDPIGAVRAGLRWLGTAEGRHQRRIAASSEGRAHIEVRRVHHPDGAALGAEAQKVIEELEGVHWAEVDAVVGRLIVMFDPDAVSPDDLVETLETIEELHEASEERFPHDRPDHPADREPIVRNMLAIAADIVGLGAATTGQMLRLIRLPSEVPGLISVVDSQPRVRHLLESRLGPPATDVVLSTVNAAAQALSQGPLGLTVDIAHRSLAVREQQARRATWERREPQLVEGRHSVGHPAEEYPERPVALPDGPIEAYADRAGFGSLGAAGVVLGATSDPRRASKLLLSGIPKAATIGREAFAAQLDRTLAGHDVITMDPAALRRLDRVDTLVLEADVVRSDHWAIGDVVGFSDESDVVECKARARQLFDPTDPLDDHRRRGWCLAPLNSGAFPLPRGAKSRGRRLGAGGLKVLGLWHDDRLEALVAVQREPATLAADVVRAGLDAGLEVMLCGGNGALARRFGLDRRLAGSRIVSEIQELQRSGRVVMLVGSGHANALRAADVGLGIVEKGKRIPWSAHIVLGPGLENVWRIIDSIPTAREVSRRSALVALAGASTGGVWSLLGPSRSAAERALLPVNGSAIMSVGLGALAGHQAGNRQAPRPLPGQHWHELEPGDSLERLATSSEGLDGEDRAHRLASSTAGVTEEPAGLVRATADELSNPLTPLLGLGAALSAAVGSVTDAALVGAVVGGNALVGAVQRMKTERSIQRLEQDSEIDVAVRIGGETRRVPRDTLVVGDVIELTGGDIVPADCRLLVAENLEVDESSVSGESLPVTKTVEATPGAPVAERASMLFEGAAIATGSAVAVVVAVGVDTESGRSLAASPKPPPSGVEQRLGLLTRLAVPVSLAGGAGVTGLGFLRGQPTRTAIGSGVSLMVAAVPEGLPALATIAQIAAARRLGANNTLVRNPRALEALGRVDQICFDKTGTLTQGSISLVFVSTGGKEEPMESLSEGGRAVLAAASRSTPPPNSDNVLPNATDRAIAAAAAEAGIDEAHDMESWDRLAEIPFESGRGYHAVLADNGTSSRLLSIKGAPESVLPLCDRWRQTGSSVPIDDRTRRALDKEIEGLGRRGLRVLAVAETTAPAETVLAQDTNRADLELVGLLAFADLVRPSAAAALQDVAAAGVNVAMITGDHASTAEAIAAELGILNGGAVLVGAELDEKTDQELDEILSDVAVFARVTPVQKVRIVEAYQRTGRSVAMTGDGANDAAAIRLADAGIALGGPTSTAAARSAADVVVTDDRIETIVDAIVEGRAMWESVRSAVAILVGGNLGEIGFILAGTALSGTAPVNARQLLLVNLLTDMAPALAIALREPRDRNPDRLLHEGPDASLGDALTREIAVRAGTTAAGASAAWAMARLTGTPTRASTVALASLVGTQLAQTLVSSGRSPLVIGATALSAGVLVATIQTPGLSQFFGCRPLGPVGWVQATGAAVGATGHRSWSLGWPSGSVR